MIFLLNDSQLLVESVKSIKMVVLKKRKVIKNLINDHKYKEEICAMEKFVYPLNIQCVVFQDIDRNNTIMEI